MKPKQLATLGITFAVAISSCTGAVETNFFDGTFNLADWTTIQVDGFDGTVSTAQVTTGGNPGYYLQVSHNDFTNWIYAFHFRQDAAYSPSNIPNALIDYSIDQLAILNLMGVGVGVQVALRQNGTNYFGPGGVNSESVWQTFSGGNVQTTNFSNFIPGNAGVGGSGHPDFSASGASIQFGFATWNNNNENLASRATGFDNWSIAVHQAPTITNITLLGSGQLQMQLLTTVGHTDSLEVSTNLLIWETMLVTNNVSIDCITLVNTNPVTNCVGRFYRVVDTVP